MAGPNTACGGRIFFSLNWDLLDWWDDGMSELGFIRLVG